MASRGLPLIALKYAMHFVQKLLLNYTMPSTTHRKILPLGWSCCPVKVPRPKMANGPFVRVETSGPGDTKDT